MIYRPDTSQGLECYVDADFVGGWKDVDHDSLESVLSYTSFFIMYPGDVSLLRRPQGLLEG